jgi:hypothetical protein
VKRLLVALLLVPYFLAFLGCLTKGMSNLILCLVVVKEGPTTRFWIHAYETRARGRLSPDFLHNFRNDLALISLRLGYNIPLDV